MEGVSIVVMFWCFDSSRWGVLKTADVATWSVFPCCKDGRGSRLLCERGWKLQFFPLACVESVWPAYRPSSGGASLPLAGRGRPFPRRRAAGGAVVPEGPGLAGPADPPGGAVPDAGARAAGLGGARKREKETRGT